MNKNYPHVLQCDDSCHGNEDSGRCYQTLAAKQVVWVATPPKNDHKENGAILIKLKPRRIIKRRLDRVISVVTGIHYLFPVNLC